MNRYGYYAPRPSSGEVAGPRDPYCGWSNFGGAADTLTVPYRGNQITIQAYQRFDTYLFGPWFVSIVPVFPISWLINAADDDELSLTVTQPINASALRANDFIIRANGRDVPASSRDSSLGDFSTLRFPIDPRSLDHFTLWVVDHGHRSQVASFHHSSRWDWLQLTPNC